MNIKFDDKPLFERLQEASLARCLVGSRSYGGTVGQYSDYDYLYIYPTPEAEYVSVFQSHHQLQYKDEHGNDHLFVSLRSFLANMVNGDSVLNFEALHTSEIRFTPLSSLAQYKYMFYSQKMVRSYLGKARKDYKDYKRLKPDETKKRLKKLGHLIRSFHFADSIRQQDFNLQNGLARAYQTKVETANLERQDFYADQMLRQIEYLRDIIDHNKVMISAVMNIKDQAFVDNLVQEIMKTHEYKKRKKMLEPFDMTLFYQANEIGVNYVV